MIDEQEFYDHGVDMASEISTFQKASGFNIYWQAHYKGEPGKTEARRAYNRGWREYKSGKFDAENDPAFGLKLLVLTLGGLGVWYFFFRKKEPPTATAGYVSGGLR